MERCLADFRDLMFANHSREKLINSILYFVEKTKYCNTIKLFKLVNFLDFEHYRQTGRSVTGLTYQAWPQGPVSPQLWDEIHQPPKDLGDSVRVVVARDELSDVPTRRDFTPQRKFDAKYFTKRELQIMERLAFYFSETTATDMSNYSHGPRMPWKKVYRQGRKDEIPYPLTLESDPIIKDMPTIDKQELEYKDNALKEIRENTG